MTKLVPIIIGGSRWIQISQLSAAQARSLKSWLPSHRLKNLTFNGILLKDCVDFSSYEYWFKTHALTSNTPLVHDF